ncbi:hypothetical protein IGI04_032256 [Brassica rapa subsp. trilocularis]|uniref:Protein kinase domain-containing protein n=1 Tax=Brassica rapa subsp. trilocularis TaxID=1813537 RepID=A0ABQ7LYT0_BRACM|nr:hypothetical protein IGI04_032256 [Brassica rapa subsp. trilocularis]
MLTIDLGYQKFATGCFRFNLGGQLLPTQHPNLSYNNISQPALQVTGDNSCKRSNIMRCYINCTFTILLSFLLMPILDSKFHTLPSWCQTNCGNINISYPFGIQEGCYLNEWYKITCRNATSPFLFKMDKEVVGISSPNEDSVSFESLSTGSFVDGKESDSALNLTGSPFFFGKENTLVAFGCNSKASLTNIEPSMVGCEQAKLRYLEKPPPYYENNQGEGEGEGSCDGNGCCSANLSYKEVYQVVGVRIESFDHRNSTSVKCRVAFLTDEGYTISEPQSFFAQGYATITIGWVIQTNTLSFLNSLSCINTEEYGDLSSNTRHKTSCLCENFTISGTHYANCRCSPGYTGNPYLFNDCKDFDECQPDFTGRRGVCRESDTCVNVVGHYKCIRDKTVPILVGLGAGSWYFGVWLLIKYLKKRKVTQRKKKFFKRNGGLLLQQQLNTREGNIEKTRIFSSRELEKATENFSESRILGQGGQGTVYKGMLVDGRTVAVKKSKVVDEDKLEEFINEIVILSQVNHRHVFIPNGNLFQHIHEESDDYTMIWGVRLRIAVDIAGAISYLHSSACSPIYHRDVKSTNIMLDEKYRAKVSDFGTSRSVTVDHTHWTTVISGTVGYVDPEYYGSSQYTDKSDVYSFGVILVELITGEKPVITLPDSQEIRGLADYFRAAMKENRFFDIMDARIRDACKPEQVMAVANLARRCLNSKGKKRPYMTEVFTELERISSSPENALVEVENEDGDDAEEEGMNMIEIADSCTVVLPLQPSVLPPRLPRQMLNHCFLVQHGEL